ncbi:S-adenosylmethionine-dependent nucleotide dehydratase RSAD2 [Trichechus manatus latirostris]|uniref:S-adenosylmethionine-dependent nucleotide dehydratase RSAD2 n=1 Tax=Trichechus manatus latirostris TaxID=127582 RepID=A0A2Y9QX99_TRIMA|nr:S-adenosylmethionine-dependent nucleotide dehydratase RSAD2 [Trichechus manatus latirostris]
MRQGEALEPVRGACPPGADSRAVSQLSGRGVPHQLTTSLASVLGPQHPSPTPALRRQSVFRQQLSSLWWTLVPLFFGLRATFWLAGPQRRQQQRGKESKDEKQEEDDNLSTTPTSVNYHFTRQCNYKCGFCFHTATTSFVLPLEEAKRGLLLLKDAGKPKMKDSYLILDEYMRFLNCRNGRKDPSKSILDVGVEAAIKFSGFDEKMFLKRGGKYVWSKADLKLDW